MSFASQVFILAVLLVMWMELPTEVPWVWDEQSMNICRLIHIKCSIATPLLNYVQPNFELRLSMGSLVYSYGTFEYAARWPTMSNRSDPYEPASDV